MKLRIEKKLEDGEYRIDIETSAFTQDEQQKIDKFGSPVVSLDPKHVFERNNQGTFIIQTSLPIHAFNHSFTFKVEHEAEVFVQSMTDRIREAITDLKSRTDHFTGENEYEF